MGRFSLAQIKSIHAQFNHIDPRSRCVREFLARCTAPKALESNPKCEISSRGRIDAQPPVVLLEYVNGVKDQINCKDMTCQQIIARVGQKTDAMDTEELLMSNGMKGLKLESRVADTQ